MNLDLYVDKNYDKYLNKDIYVISSTDILPRTFCAKFLDFTNKKKLNNELDLLLRKPIDITVSIIPESKIKIRRDQYHVVVSKELLDVFDILINENNIPTELKDIIKEFIPEYGKLF